MNTQFQVEVFQNPYLPQGATAVNAIMTVTLTGDGGSDMAATGDRQQFGIICDVSGSMTGNKIAAAKAAIVRLIQLLPEDSLFFVVTGSSRASLVVPTTIASERHKQQAIVAVNRISVGGGTLISTWLTAALQEFQSMPTALRQALLLTDGLNDGSDEQPLATILQQCEGVFQCDCRGVGTNWHVSQLRQIADKLLGTTDIVPDASDLEADFQAILQKAMQKTVSAVNLRLWTPQGAKVQFCKQVSPAILDLTDRAKPVKPQVIDYPTGAWSVHEPRDYHFSLQSRLAVWVMQC